MKRLYIIIVALACCASAFSQDIPFDKNYFQNQKDAFKEANGSLKDGESFFSKEYYLADITVIIKTVLIRFVGVEKLRGLVYHGCDSG